MVKKILLLLFVLVFAVLAGGYFYAGNIVKTGTNRYAPEVLKVDVSLEDVDLSPLSGEMEFQGFRMGQPEGFGEGDMVSLPNFYIKLRPETLLDDHIIIDKILIEAPRLDARVKKGKSNFGALSEKLAEAIPESPADEPEKTLTIHELRVVTPQLAASTDLGVKTEKDISLASITITELGTDEEGMRYSEIARHIMAVLEPQVAQALVKSGLQEHIKSLAEDKLGSILEDNGLKKPEKGKDLIGGLISGFKKKKSDEGTERDKVKPGGS